MTKKDYERHLKFLARDKQRLNLTNQFSVVCKEIGKLIKCLEPIIENLQEQRAQDLNETQAIIQKYEKSIKKIR